MNAKEIESLLIVVTLNKSAKRRWFIWRLVKKEPRTGIPDIASPILFSSQDAIPLGSGYPIY